MLEAGLGVRLRGGRCGGRVLRTSGVLREEGRRPRGEEQRGGRRRRVGESRFRIRMVEDATPAAYRNPVPFPQAGSERLRRLDASGYRKRARDERVRRASALP